MGGIVALKEDGCLHSGAPETVTPSVSETHARNPVDCGRGCGDAMTDRGNSFAVRPLSRPGTEGVLEEFEHPLLIDRNVSLIGAGLHVVTFPGILERLDELQGI